MSTPPRYPADTPRQRRTAIHAAVDRVLDVRPDLEDGVVNLFAAVVRKLEQPGAMAQIGLLAAGKHLFDALDRQPQRPADAPPQPPGFHAR